MSRLLRALLVFALAGLPTLAGAAEAVASAPAFRTIVLVRHGHYAPDPAADPRLGPHLSTLGVAQARLVGARLAGLPVRFDLLYASPLQRARDTAASIAADLPGRAFEVLDDLAECTPPSREPRVAASEKPADLATCKQQLERLYTARFRPAEGASSTELYVCHGNVIRYLTTRALGVDPTAWLSMSIGHASITRIRIAPDGSMQVIAVGDVGHLPPNLQTGASGDAERSLENTVLAPAG
jgi:serine/threonine-protein phosphatase PGAM5